MAAPLRAFSRDLLRNAPKIDIMLQHRACAHRRLHASSVRCEKWQIFSAVCLERNPIITQPFKSDSQKKWIELLKRMEFEGSVLCDHELRHLEDLRVAESRQEADFKESELTLRQTAVEFEDASEAEFKQFQPASRVTEADEKKDMKSTERQLDRKLILLVKQKFGEKDYWCLPQNKWTEGHSMRQSAEQTLSELCGELDVMFMGNAPCGFIKYKYPQEEQEKQQCDGAKVFFYKVQFKGGDINPKKREVSDYAWVTKKELSQYIASHQFRHKIYDFVTEL